MGGGGANLNSHSTFTTLNPCDVPESLVVRLCAGLPGDELAFVQRQLISIVDGTGGSHLTVRVVEVVRKETPSSFLNVT